MESAQLKWSDLTENPCGSEDFLRAGKTAKIPEGCQPLYDSIERARNAETYVQFQSPKALLLPKYNFVLNVLMQLSRHEHVGKDFYLSCRAMSDALKASGVSILSFRWVSSYFEWAKDEGFIVQTAKHHFSPKKPGESKARRYRWVTPQVGLLQ
jgi:hypothetical protein